MNRFGRPAAFLIRTRRELSIYNHLESRFSRQSTPKRPTSNVCPCRRVKTAQPRQFLMQKTIPEPGCRLRDAAGRRNSPASKHWSSWSFSEHTSIVCSECMGAWNIVQNYAKSTALVEYVLKMPLGVQNGSLGDQNEHFYHKKPLAFFLGTERTISTYTVSTSWISVSCFLR